MSNVIPFRRTQPSGPPSSDRSIHGEPLQLARPVRAFESFASELDEESWPTQLAEEPRMRIIFRGPDGLLHRTTVASTLNYSVGQLSELERLQYVNHLRSLMALFGCEPIAMESLTSVAIEAEKDPGSCGCGTPECGVCADEAGVRIA